MSSPPSFASDHVHFDTPLLSRLQSDAGLLSLLTAATSMSYEPSNMKTDGRHLFQLHAATHRSSTSSMQQHCLFAHYRWLYLGTFGDATCLRQMLVDPSADLATIGVSSVYPGVVIDATKRGEDVLATLREWMANPPPGSISIRAVPLAQAVTMRPPAALSALARPSEHLLTPAEAKARQAGYHTPGQIRQQTLPWTAESARPTIGASTQTTTESTAVVAQQQQEVTTARASVPCFQRCESLVIFGFHLPDHFSASSFPVLSTLRLSGIRQSDSVITSSLMSALLLPSLTSLHLHFIKAQLTLSLLECQFSLFQQKVHTLDIDLEDWPAIDSFTAKLISVDTAASSLKKLSLGSGRMSVQAVLNLSRLPHLHSLSLLSPVLQDGLDSAMAAAVHSFSLQSFFPALRRVRLFPVGETTSSLMWLLGSLSSQLWEANLSSTTEDGPDWTAASTGMTELYKLTLFQQSPFVFTATNMRRLHTLSLHECSNNAEQMGVALAACPQLADISLSSCQHLTVDVLGVIAQHCRDVRVVYITMCDRFYLTDTAFAASNLHSTADYRDGRFFRRLHVLRLDESKDAMMSRAAFYDQAGLERLVDVLTGATESLSYLYLSSRGSNRLSCRQRLLFACFKRLRSLQCSMYSPRTSCQVAQAMYDRKASDTSTPYGFQYTTSDGTEKRRPYWQSKPPFDGGDDDIIHYDVSRLESRTANQMNRLFITSEVHHNMAGREAYFYDLAEHVTTSCPDGSAV